MTADADTGRYLGNAVQTGTDLTSGLLPAAGEPLPPLLAVFVIARFGISHPLAHQAGAGITDFRHVDHLLFCSVGIGNGRVSTLRRRNARTRKTAAAPGCPPAESRSWAVEAVGFDRKNCT